MKIEKEFRRGFEGVVKIIWDARVTLATSKFSMVSL